jgi:cell wall-associated NlpC family hydrolase
MQATDQATRAAHYPGPAPAAAMRAAPGLLSPRPVTAALLLAAALLAGCGRDDVRPTRPQAAARDWPRAAPADPAAANAVLMRAISLVGTPYRYGGNTPEGGFDCSGLVNYVFRDMLDLQLPRTSRALAGYQGPRIPADRLATADLVFFGRGGSVTHVGIYVGEGRFVHAPTSGGTVRLDRLDGHYWRDNYSGARRVLN